MCETNSFKVCEGTHPLQACSCFHGWELTRKVSYIRGCFMCIFEFTMQIIHLFSELGSNSISLRQHCDLFYLTGRCSWILAMRPMEGSERVYMVARIAMTTNSHEDGLAGYTPVITLFCMGEAMNKHKKNEERRPE